MSISFINFSFVLPLLILPFFLLIQNHPNKIINKLAKFLILLLVIISIIAIPVYSIVEIGIKILIIPLFPILSRIVTYLLEKTNIFRQSHIILIDKLLGISAFTIVLVLTATTHEQPLKIIASLILIIIFLFFIDIRKYTLLSNVFGIILSTYMITQVPSEVFTVTFIYIICMILVRIFDKRFSFSEKSRNSVERWTIFVIVCTSYILSQYGGINFDVSKLFIQISIFTSLLFLYLGSTYLLGKSTIPLIVEQYVPILSLCVLMFFVISFMNNPKFMTIFNPVFYLLNFIFLNLIFLRVLSPLDKFLSDSNFFKLDNILCFFKFYFGDKFGELIYKILCGKDPKVIKPIYSITILLITLLMVIFTDKNSMFKNEIFYSFNTWYLFLSVYSVFACFSFVLSLVKVIDKEYIDSGMNNEQARKNSTVVVINYFFTLIPFLCVCYEYVDKISFIGVLLIILYIFFFIIGINFTLWQDFLNPNYNNFMILRGYLSIALIAISHIILIILFYYFYDSSNPIRSFQNILKISFIIYLVAGIFSRTFSHDNFFGSKKCKKISFFCLITIVILFVPSLLSVNIIFQIIGFSQIVAARVTLFFETLLFMYVVLFLVIILSKASNDNYKGSMKNIFKEWEKHVKERRL